MMMMKKTDLQVRQQLRMAMMAKDGAAMQAIPLDHLPTAHHQLLQAAVLAADRLGMAYEGEMGRRKLAAMGLEPIIDEAIHPPSQCKLYTHRIRM